MLCIVFELTILMYSLLINKDSILLLYACMHGVADCYCFSIDYSDRSYFTVHYWGEPERAPH